MKIISRTKPLRDKWIKQTLLPRSRKFQFQDHQLCSNCLFFKLAKLRKKVTLSQWTDFVLGGAIFYRLFSYFRGLNRVDVKNDKRVYQFHDRHHILGEESEDSLFSIGHWLLYSQYTLLLQRITFVSILPHGCSILSYPFKNEFQILRWCCVRIQ